MRGSLVHDALYPLLKEGPSFIGRQLLSMNRGIDSGKSVANALHG
jgi:hypothetical protein